MNDATVRVRFWASYSVTRGRRINRLATEITGPIRHIVLIEAMESLRQESLPLRRGHIKIPDRAIGIVVILGDKAPSSGD